MTICATPSDLGAIRAVLATVDCNTQDFARLGYASLTSTHSSFQLALTALLTIYVSLLGYRLMFGTGLRLSDSPGIALKIGAILALVTNWSTFQTLVFDVGSQVPFEIAAVIASPMQSRSELAEKPIDGLQSAYDQIATAADAFAASARRADIFNGQPAPITASSGDLNARRTAEAGETLQTAANVVFIASTGLIAVATVAIGVLTAVGPLFVALFLFLETRGVFAGWVRALGAAGFALLSTWTLVVLMLVSLDPWLLRLAQEQASGRFDVETAMTTACIVFVFSASQVGLILIGGIVALGFRLRSVVRTNPWRDRVSETAAPSVSSKAELSRAARLAEQLYQPAGTPTFADAIPPPASRSNSGRASVAATYSGSTGAQSRDWYRRPAVSRLVRQEELS